MAKLLTVDTRALERMASDLADVSDEARRSFASRVGRQGSRVMARNMARPKGGRAPQDVAFGTPRVTVNNSGTGTATVPVRALSGGLAGGPPFGWELVDFGTRKTRRGRRLPRHVPGGRVVSPSLSGLSSWLGALAQRVYSDEIRKAGGS